MNSEDDILACQYNRWSPQFEKCIPRVLIKSSVITLPTSFIDYLKSDGLFLPKSVQVSSLGTDQLSDDDDITEISTSSEEQVHDVTHFEELNKSIQHALVQLGGKVFVKLNWSAPTDSAWINGGSIACTAVGDVYMVLKASNRLSVDLDHMFDHCACQRTQPEPFTLVIKKWANLHPAMNFRGFVYHRRLIGLSQRDCSTVYEFLLRDREDIELLLLDFFEARVKTTFPLQSYAFDVYVDKDRRVWLLDFGVFGPPTDALLFDWRELQSLGEAEAVPCCHDDTRQDSSSAPVSLSASESVCGKEVTASMSPSTEAGVEGVGMEAATVGTPSSVELDIGQGLGSGVGSLTPPVTSAATAARVGGSVAGGATMTAGGHDWDRGRDVATLAVQQGGRGVELRLVHSALEVLPGTAAGCRGPIDAADAAISDFATFMRTCRNQKYNNDYSDSDSEEG